MKKSVFVDTRTGGAMSTKTPALQEFLWQTMDGRVLQLSEMTTKHVFNAMKMCFNHLAAAAGGQPVWFTHQYREYRQASHHTPEQLAWLVVLFIEEIERRRDLPSKYAAPYNAIVEQIRPRLPEPERSKLPPADHWQARITEEP